MSDSKSDSQTDSQTDKQRVKCIDLTMSDDDNEEEEEEEKEEEEEEEEDKNGIDLTRSPTVSSQIQMFQECLAQVFDTGMICSRGFMKKSLDHLCGIEFFFLKGFTASLKSLRFFKFMHHFTVFIGGNTLYHVVKALTTLLQAIVPMSSPELRHMHVLKCKHTRCVPFQCRQVRVDLDAKAVVFETI